MKKNILMHVSIASMFLAHSVMSFAAEGTVENPAWKSELGERLVHAADGGEAVPQDCLEQFHFALDESAVLSVDLANPPPAFADEEVAFGAQTRAFKTVAGLGETYELVAHSRSSVRYTLEVFFLRGSLNRIALTKHKREGLVFWNYDGVVTCGQRP